jgi:cytidine deaminase
LFLVPCAFSFMRQKKFEFSFEVYAGIDELNAEDQQLLTEARNVTDKAYAPYSNFHVGAAAKLGNGKIVTGTNQENASYPVGICAERVLLSAISSLYLGIPVETMAVSYQSKKMKSDHPISPCGMCRQALQEFEGRTGKPIRLILAGMEGEIYIIDSASQLLPLAFSSEELG